MACPSTSNHISVPEMDALLEAHGLLEEGMNAKEKEDLLIILEESKKSAQNEEKTREGNIDDEISLLPSSPFLRKFASQRRSSSTSPLIGGAGLRRRPLRPENTQPDPAGVPQTSNWPASPCGHAQSPVGSVAARSPRAEPDAAGRRRLSSGSVSPASPSAHPSGRRTESRSSPPEPSQSQQPAASAAHSDEHEPPENGLSDREDQPGEERRSRRVESLLRDRISDDLEAELQRVLDYLEAGEQRRWRRLAGQPSGPWPADILPTRGFSEASLVPTASRPLRPDGSDSPPPTDQLAALPAARRRRSRDENDDDGCCLQTGADDGVDPKVDAGGDSAPRRSVSPAGSAASRRHSRGSRLLLNSLSVQSSKPAAHRLSLKLRRRGDLAAEPAPPLPPAQARRDAPPALPELEPAKGAARADRRQREPSPSPSPAQTRRNVLPALPEMEPAQSTARTGRRQREQLPALLSSDVADAEWQCADGGPEKRRRLADQSEPTAQQIRPAAVRFPRRGKQERPSRALVPLLLATHIQAKPSGSSKTVAAPPTAAGTERSSDEEILATAPNEDILISKISQASATAPGIPSVPPTVRSSAALASTTLSAVRLSAIPSTSKAPASQVSDASSTMWLSATKTSAAPPTPQLSVAGSTSRLAGKPSTSRHSVTPSTSRPTPTSSTRPSAAPSTSQLAATPSTSQSSATLSASWAAATPSASRPWATPSTSRPAATRPTSRHSATPPAAVRSSLVLPAPSSDAGGAVVRVTQAGAPSVSAASDAAPAAASPGQLDSLLVEVECPICGDFYPKERIEGHASTCEGDVVVIRDSPSPPLVRRTATLRGARPRTPQGMQRCRLCDVVVPDGPEFLEHSDECVLRRRQMSDDGEVPAEAADHPLVTESSAVGRDLRQGTSTLSDDGAGPRTFQRISAQTDSCIDYHNQFATADGSGPTQPRRKHRHGGNARGRRRSKGRGSTRRRWKKS